MGKTVIENTPQINWESLQNLKSGTTIYHSDEDTLFLRPQKPRPATSFDWDGELWVRFDPQTGEIVGIEIENFEQIFIKKHPELTKVWQEFKPLCKHKRTRSSDESILESFIRILMQFISELFQTNPQQAPLPAM